MKLLIVTQTVDTKDPTLGFFVRWLEEFAQHCEKITVICLRKGKYSLPDNVEVIALGKASRLMRMIQVWDICISRRSEYEVVFVHMNPNTLLRYGWLWKLMHKRIALWYTHKSVNMKLRIAAAFSDIIFTASKESFRLKSSKVRIMGHGIDTEFFSPDTNVARGDWMISVYRLTKSKRHDLAIQRAVDEGRVLRIAGEGPEHARLEAWAQKKRATVQFLGALTQTQLRDEYRTAAYLIHTSETGSLDKVVLEALACGLPVRTNDPALKMLENASPAYIREHHSLQRLIPALLGAIAL